jgi:hypothetical protein
MMRLIAPILLVIVVGLLPLAVTHAQSATTTAQREADRASAKTNSV